MKKVLFLFICILCVQSLSAEHVQCRLCEGSGHMPICQCFGKGQVYILATGSWVTCKECGGTGKSKKVCNWCNGKGYLETKQNSSSSSGSSYSTPTDKTCYQCNGNGNCSNCHGRGVITGYWNSTGHSYSRECGSCGGTGKCSSCHGKGHL